MTVRRLLAGKGDFVPTVPSDAKVNDAISQMELDEAGALVVTDEALQILGIISERDIVRALKASGINALDAPISSVMTRDVITCDFEQPVNRILQLMDEHQIRHVPILKDGELHGIIDMLDLVKYRLNELELETNVLRDYVTGRV